MNQSPKFCFKLVQKEHRCLIHDWLAMPHVIEWFYGDGLNNTLKYLDEFLAGSAPYQYWLICDDNHPIGFFMTSKVEKPNDVLTKWCEEEGEAITLDMLIGDQEYLGKGFAHQIIQEFLQGYFSHVSEVFIDPETTNTRAVHV